MATYNGGQYIAQQLDSIRAQTFTDWRIFIRDDSSCDNTVDVLRQYAELDPRIILIEDSLGGLRVSKNFETAISYCTAPYTMLADQDDVWFEDKIEKSLAYIQQVEKLGLPILVFSNSILTNSDLSIKLGPNYSFDMVPRFENFIFCNAGYQGAAMIFNKALREKLFPFLERSKVHDYHISLIGFWLGEIYFLNQPLMLYRRHETTTTVSNYTLLQRIKSFLKGVPMLSDPELVDYLIRLSTNRASYISDCYKMLVDAYLQIVDPKMSFLRKVTLVKKYKFTLRNSYLYLIFKLLFVK